MPDVARRLSQPFVDAKRDIKRVSRDCAQIWRPVVTVFAFLYSILAWIFRAFAKVGAFLSGVKVWRPWRKKTTKKGVVLGGLVRAGKKAKRALDKLKSSSTSGKKWHDD